jgi:hypothetical protein
VKNNLKEEIFILAPGFRGFSPWSVGSLAFRPEAMQNHHGGRTWHREAAYLIKARKQREKGVGDKVNSSKSHPTDLLPPTGPHLLIAHSAMN